eukprot:GHRR01036239.1.p1 GENE.GHRR01036239.1~~GHRR01036239.1.p1  ORF type:complete len:173 (+),score=18.46 GHRR01036239.1:240-758(+)
MHLHKKQPSNQARLCSYYILHLTCNVMICSSLSFSRAVSAIMMSLCLSSSCLYLSTCARSCSAMWRSASSSRSRASYSPRIRRCSCSYKNIIAAGSGYVPGLHDNSRLLGNSGASGSSECQFKHVTTMRAYTLKHARHWQMLPSLQPGRLPTLASSVLNAGMSSSLLPPISN